MKAKEGGVVWQGASPTFDDFEHVSVFCFVK
jgi:hypothetical protein